MLNFAYFCEISWFSIACIRLVNEPMGSLSVKIDVARLQPTSPVPCIKRGRRFFQMTIPRTVHPNRPKWSGFPRNRNICRFHQKHTFQDSRTWYAWEGMDQIWPKNIGWLVGKSHQPMHGPLGFTNWPRISAADLQAEVLVLARSQQAVIWRS